MIRSTNTQWFNIINYDFFTIYFARPTTLPDLVKIFSRYSKPIGLRFEKTISIDEHFILLSSLTNLTSLEIEPNFSIEGRSNSLSAQHTAYFTALMNLQRLDLCQAEVTPYIQHFPKLTTLEIRVEHGSDRPFNYHEYSAEDMKILSKLGNHTDLRSLNVDDYDSCLQFDAEDITKMSKLSHLSITDYRDRSKFPFNKLPNLESLDIYCDEFDDFLVNSKLTKLIIGLLDEVPSTVPGQLASLHKLKYLVLHGGFSNEQLSFICKLTELEYFSNGYLNGPSRGSFLQLINSSNLTSLSVRGLIPSLEYVSHLTNLQQLKYWSPHELPGVPSFTLPNVTKLVSWDIPMAEMCPNVKEFTVFGRTEGEKELDVLASLTALEHLNMTVPLKEHLKVISKHTQLTQLEFNLGLKPDNSDLQSLTRLRKLKLYYRDSALDSEAIRSMTNLEELSLNQFSEDMIETLERLPKLKVLLVDSTAVERIPVTKLSNLTNLQVLRWSSPSNSIIPKKTNLLLPYLYKHF